MVSMRGLKEVFLPMVTKSVVSVKGLLVGGVGPTVTQLEMLVRLQPTLEEMVITRVMPSVGASILRGLTDNLG
jgi:hypothetical protein